MTDQKVPDGTRERPEGGSVTPESLEGQNEPQAGAQSLQAVQPRGPVDGARQQAADRETTTRVLAALHRSAEADVTRIIQLAEQWATRPERADALRELTDALGYGTKPPASSDGPSVREAAVDDRRWWDGEKAGEA